jgi:hypothetical protein
MMNKAGEKDIFDLLASLKNAGNQYPPDLMQSRRELFAKQAASAAIAMHAAGIKQELSGASQATAGVTGIGSSVGSLLETILIIALIVEAGIATYIFRDKIADLISSIISPRVEQIATPADDSSLPVGNIPATIDVTSSASPAATLTVTPIPSITLTAGSQINDGNNNGDGGQAVSTPDPNGNNGLHLGQTKQPPNEPQATKEPSDNSTNDSSSGNKKNK